MSVFRFKYFEVQQKNASMKVGFDAMILGALTEVKSQLNILDIGTGTGVLSLMLMQKNKNSMITAIDIDEQNVQIAKSNFMSSDWSSRMNSFHIDLFEYKTNVKHDLIITNPPFFLDSLSSPNTRNSNAKHFKKSDLSLFFKLCYSWIKASGDLWMITSVDHELEWLENAKMNGFNLKKKWNIYGKPGSHNRSILNFSKSEVKHTIENSLLVRDKNGIYTDDYKSLTREYHGELI